MPTLRIQFPEKDSPSTLVLDGAKITLGRRADNTIQIVDRTISAFHAEFIREDDHYRLHDLGSTNGTCVNGEPVTDYHLREACKVSFGPVECEFSPEAVQGSPVEKLPTRVEIDAISRENQNLRAQLQTLQQETDSLRKVTEMAGDSAGSELMQEEIQRLIRERSDLQETAQTREREMGSLRTELARMNRDRWNLQEALSRANAEIANLKQASAAPTETQAKSTAETPAPAAQPVAPARPAGVSGLPKPTSVGESAPASRPAPSPAAPSAPSTPVAPASAPRPMTAPKPMARPAVAASGVTAAPKPRVVSEPAGVASAASRTSNSGPSGTQKISIPSQTPATAAAKATPLPRPARPLGQVPAATATGEDQGA